MQGNDDEGALEYQNDPILHKLFIQIVKLIEFFLKELANFQRMEKPGSGEQMVVE